MLDSESTELEGVDRVIEKAIRLGITLALAAVYGSSVAMAAAADSPQATPAISLTGVDSQQGVASTDSRADINPSVTEAPNHHNGQKDRGDGRSGQAIGPLLNQTRDQTNSATNNVGDSNNVDSNTTVAPNQATFSKTGRQNDNSQPGSILNLSVPNPDRAAQTSKHDDATATALPSITAAAVVPLSPAVMKAVTVAAAVPHIPLGVTSMSQSAPFMALETLTVPAVAPPAAHAPASQSSAPAPVPLSGMFYQIQSMLANIFVPVPTGLPVVAGLLGLDASALAIFPVILLTVILLQILHIPMTSYAERLRRSGYLGAPRSHVVSATVSFATPQKWVVSAVVMRT